MRAAIAWLTMMVAAPVSAQTAAEAPAQPPCALPLAAPAPFAGWTRPAPLTAAEQRGARPLPMLVPGRAAAVTLAPEGVVTFAAAPGRRGGATRYGGMIYLTVATAGHYRIALGTPAWIDLVAPGGGIVASAGHDHGPACSGIVKLVDFALTPGTYAVQLAAAPSPVTTVMAVPVPVPVPVPVR